MVRTGSQLAISPFTRLLLPLCIGVSLPLGSMDINPVMMLVLLLVVWVILMISFKGTFYFQPFWGCLLFVGILLFGVQREKQQRMLFPPLPKQRYFVVADEFPLEKEKTFLVVGQLINAEQRIMVYLPKLQPVKMAKPGDLFCFEGLPELVENSGNPFEFDYRRYLNNRGIGYRIFLRENQFYFLDGTRELNVFRRALIVREKVIEWLGRSGIKIEYLDLVASISFGAREDVDKETIQSFTNTGVIHVLAVSGMNIGLIFVILDFMFRFLKSRRAGYFLHAAIMLSGIWGYALITGMSASILRAATMFSFVLIGTTLRRNAAIFNSLAVSAFLLIALNPSILRDIGFQLSYAAILAIVVIQPLIYRMLYVKNRLLDKTWLLLSVTIAAQIGTLPLTLHYFHQFPVYFLPANAVVIPLVSLILYLSFVVVGLSFVSGWLTTVFGYLLGWSVQLVLATVKHVEALPFSIIRGLNPTIYHFVIFFLIGLFLFMYLKSRKIHHLQTVMVLAIGLCLLSGISSWNSFSRKEVIFLNIPGTRSLVLTSGRESLVLYDRCDKASDKIGYTMKPYLVERKIRKAEMHQLSDSLRIDAKDFCVVGNFILFRGIRLYIQPSFETKIQREDRNLRCDLVWLAASGPEKSKEIDFPNSKIILHHASEKMKEYQIRTPDQKCFDMSKAVRVVVGSRRPGNLNGMLCGYFNE